MNNKTKKKVHNPENNLEIISPNQNNDLIMDAGVEAISSDTVSITSDGIRVKKSGNLVVGSLNLVINPLRKRWRRDYSGNTWHLIADTFLIFLIVTLIMFVYLTNNWSESRAFSLKINSEGPTIAGSLKSFELEYKSNYQVDNTLVQLFLPQNFIINSVYPKNLFDEELNTLNLGALEKNSSGRIKINGFIWGELHDRQDISFRLDCSRCGKNGLVTSLFYDIEKLPIESSLLLNDNLFFNSDFSGVLTLKNNTNNPLENIKINLGSDIEIKKSNLPVENGNILLNKINSGEENSINFDALCREDNNVKISPKFSINLSNNSLYFYGEEKNIDVKRPNLNISVISDNNYAEDGEKILYKLTYDNQEKFTIKNVKITIASANPNFLLESLESVNNPKGVIVSGNTIMIEDLLEGESGLLFLNALFDRRQSAPNQELFLKISLQYEIDGQIVKYVTYSNKNKLSSKISASASAHYYSPQGDQLGVGPLPPAVNMSTNYWIFLEVNNLGNSLENFILTADFPENVYFSDNKRILDGKLFYGEVSKRATWELPLIKGENGRYRANFEIGLIPGDDDIGRILELLKNIKFTAKDTFTGQEIIRNLPDIDTNLENDKLSSGKGVVRIIK